MRLEPWAEGDLPLLTKLLGDPEMTVHLGGPESAEKLAERQAKYERLPDSGTGWMFKIVDEETGEAVGSVGYWDKTWREQEVYETGWSVLPAFQGRGIAVEATTQAIARAKSDGKHRYLHAFPSVENGAVERDLPEARLHAARGRTSSSTRRATRCSATTGGSTCRPKGSANLTQTCQAGRVPLRDPDGMLVESPSRGCRPPWGAGLAARFAPRLDRTAQSCRRKPRRTAGNTHGGTQR